jgi:hypothetical protein
MERLRDIMRTPFLGLPHPSVSLRMLRDAWCLAVAEAEMEEAWSEVRFIVDAGTGGEMALRWWLPSRCVSIALQ